MKYRKKPIVVEAVQWNGSLQLIHDFGVGYTASGGDVFIHTLEGPVRCKPSDWIVKGIKGEFYPVRDDIFQASYEIVEE